MTERTRRRLNAARARARQSAARLFVFEEAAPDQKSGLVPVTLGTDTSGEVTTGQGWYVEPRRLNHVGTPVAMKVHIGQSVVFTPAVAAKVAAVAIVEPDAADAPILRVEPIGIPSMPVEDEWVYDVAGPTKKTHTIGA